MRGLLLTLIAASCACFGFSLGACVTDPTAKDIHCLGDLVVFNNFSTNVDWTKTNAWLHFDSVTDQAYYLDLYTTDDFATPWWYDVTTLKSNEAFLGVEAPAFKSYKFLPHPGGPESPAVTTGTPIIAQHFCGTLGTGSSCIHDLSGGPVISRLTVTDRARLGLGSYQVHPVGDPVQGGTVDHLVTIFAMPEPVTSFLVGGGLFTIFIVRRRQLSHKRKLPIAAS
jgi:hypothetical protein